ncbi:MAG: hypothetical protein P8Y69_18770 [Gammaproteobacteria bacterium]
MNLKKIALPIAAACALLSLMSCGGGGGNGVMQQPAPINQPPPADNTGVVGILLKDAPTLDFTRIVMVITSVELLGNGDPKSSSCRTSTTCWRCPTRYRWVSTTRFV